MSFKIIVDSCCDLTPAMMASGDFIPVPLTLQVGGDTIVDDASFDQADLLWRMKNCDQGAGSACPSPAAYLSAFDCGADELYVVTLSALLSGSHNSAAQARLLWLEDHPDAKVHVFNSCSASSYISGMQTYFVLENLDNLRKNGRLTRLQSIVTDTLKIKLLMGSTPEGEICRKGQALSIRQALSRMAALMAADSRHEGRTLCITHCNCLQRAFALKEQVLAACRFGEILICDAHGVSSLYANDGGVIAAY